eukprot:gene239-433_t
MASLNRIIELENAVMELSSMLTQHESRFLQSVNESLVEEEVAWAPDSGDTAWMLASTALVLMMTMPGLAIYYGGMVRVQNVLATAMQSLSITCMITFLWLCIGYSLCFAPVDKVLKYTRFSPIGDASRMWLLGIDMYSSHKLLAPTIPESVFCTYQLTFAIITPALICGSFADRMKYGSMLVFMFFWHILVYCPIAHANWHPNGFLFKIGCMDFAGGNVVHISSGIAGLMSTIVIGNRQGFGTERFEPHNILLTFMGAAMLWVGWFGFNAGSALGANARAGMAMLTTQIATAMGSLTWMLTEWAVRKQPSVLGMLSGAVAGLVAITPACGFVDQTGAFIIGICAGPFCYGCAQLKHMIGYDDALDAFGVHATGGILGGLMTGLFARKQFSGIDGAFYAKNGNQFVCQIWGVLFSVGWSGVVSFIILKVLDMTIGLRVSAKDEIEGLDSSVHGETIMTSSAHGLDKSNHAGSKVTVVQSNA